MDNEPDVLEVKRQLLQLCVQMQQDRVDHARKAMEDAQQSANQEERSTAGDKYDTSRAMSHNVRDMNARQLQEALKELALLGQLNPVAGTAEVRLGSLVRTSAGNYFVAVSGGPFTVAGQTYFAVSTAAPLGRELLGKKAGDTFPFRGKPFRINEVW
jgi:hypothetical protein